MYPKSESAVQIVNTRFEALDYLSNAAHFIKFNLKLVNLAKYGSKAGDFRVCHLHGVASAVVLNLGRRLGLLGKLRLPSALRHVSSIAAYAPQLT